MTIRQANPMHIATCAFQSLDALLPHLKSHSA